MTFKTIILVAVLCVELMGQVVLAQDKCAETLRKTALSEFAENVSDQVVWNSTQIFPRVFQGVEVFRRNNDIGIQQLGELKLTQWVETHFINNKIQSLVGLSQEGRVFQVVHYGPQRTIARLLSGQQSFKEIYMSEKGQLFAVKSDGSVHAYLSNKWAQSPLRKIIKDAGKLWLATSLSLVALTKSFTESSEMIVLVESTLANFTALDLTISAATLLSVTLNMSNRFQSLNTLPDGFTKTSFTKANLNEKAAQWSANERPTDFVPPDADKLPGKIHEAGTEPIN